MSSYLEWNDKIADLFFRPEMAGQSVWLYLTEEVIQELASQLGNEGLSDFVAAVKTGPDWVRARGLCQRALQAYHAWRDSGLQFPPYLAYLALFVLAAGREGGFAVHAYYPRLRALLNEPGEGPLPSFDRMLELWDDLEKWSISDCGGQLGIFSVRHVGKWIYVGVPLAQTILAGDERKALPLIFAEAGFDPTSPPPDEAIAQALRSHGRGRLHHRTLELLRSRGDSERFAALLDIAEEALTEWTGVLEEEPTPEGGGITAYQTGLLRLCLRHDRTAQTLSPVVRIRTKQDLPEGRLQLSGPDIPSPLTCVETLPGWSSPLALSDSGQPLDGALLDWEQGTILSDDSLRWRVKLPPGDVRIFVKAEGEGLPGLIESHQLSAFQPFYLAFPERLWPRLSEWADSECNNFKTQTIIQGLPSGWRFASCDGAVGDEHIRTSIPALSFSQRIRLRFIRGARSMPGSNFFAFVPPEVMLEGGGGSEQVRCQGRLLTQQDQNRIFTLPEGLPTGNRIIIEVLAEGEVQRASSLFLTGDFGWRRGNPVRLFDRWGEETKSLPGIAGACLSGFEGIVHMFKYLPTSAVGFEELTEHTIYLLGRTPGQVLCWPSEPLQESWEPVWAIQVGRRRGLAVCCAQALENAGPKEGKFGDRSRQGLWKELLWHRRKKIAAPEFPMLRKLWNAYVEIAHAL